jgi:hypothetical protein
VGRAAWGGGVDRVSAPRAADPPIQNRLSTAPALQAVPPPCPLCTLRCVHALLPRVPALLLPHASKLPMTECRHISRSRPPCTLGSRLAASPPCSLCASCCVHALLPRVRACSAAPRAPSRACCHRPVLASEQRAMVPSAAALPPGSRVLARPPTPACSILLPRAAAALPPSRITSATPLPRTQNNTQSRFSVGAQAIVSGWALALTSAQGGKRRNLQAVPLPPPHTHSQPPNT